MKYLKWFTIVIIFFLLIVVGLIRFTDGTISNPSHIILGYDETEGRFQIWEKKIFKLNGIDGPYIIDNQKIEVTNDNKIQYIKILRKDVLSVKVNNLDQDTFSLKLKDSIVGNADQYTMPEKLIAISDIEGNFNAFASFLIKHGVIDQGFNWIFGNGHLVLIGDFVDRGEDVTQVLWLVYKIEDQAKAQKGEVHYILGNHEIMNFQGNHSYNQKKYKRVAQLISKNENISEALKYMYSNQTELGKWLRSKNVIEKIGEYIFVHGGLSPDILKFNLKLKDINLIAKNTWDKNFSGKDDSSAENFVNGEKGVFWYRGLATDYKYYPKISDNELVKVLAYYNAKKIIFGHTVVDNITKEWNGKAINIDVAHGREKYSDKTKGLMIYQGNEYVIDGAGNKVKL